MRITSSFHKSLFFKAINPTKKSFKKNLKKAPKEFANSEKVPTFAPVTEKQTVTTNKNKGAIAQLVEQRTENPCVPGSIPGGTTFRIMILKQLQQK